MAETDYTIYTTNPTVSGDIDQHGGMIINGGVNWQPALGKVPTLEHGVKRVPDTPRGQIAVSIMAPPTGFDTPVELCRSDCPVDLYYNGSQYDNVFHTGGRVQTREFSPTSRTLVITKLYTVLGLCATET